MEKITKAKFLETISKNYCGFYGVVENNKDKIIARVVSNAEDKAKEEDVVWNKEDIRKPVVVNAHRIIFEDGTGEETVLGFNQQGKYEFYQQGKQLVVKHTYTQDDFDENYNNITREMNKYFLYALIKPLTK